MTWSKLLTYLPLLVVLSTSPSVLAAEGQFLGAKETIYPNWFKQSFLDIREDIAEAAEQNKRLVMIFHQTGCPYCNLLVERNLSQKDIEQKIKQSFDVIEVNMWGDREVTGFAGTVQAEKAFAAGLRVQFTPTLLFFDEHGRVVLRLNGYVAPEKFMTALTYVAERQEQRVSFRDYLAAKNRTPSSGTLNTQTYFAKPPYNLVALNRPLAIFFEQRQCPSCDRLHEEVLLENTVRNELIPYVSVQLDMWSNTPVVTPSGVVTTARAWAKELNVVYAPSIVLFNREGIEVIRAEAYFKRFHTASLFNYVSSSAYRHEPNFQRYISERSERIRKKGVDVDIWK